MSTPSPVSGVLLGSSGERDLQLAMQCLDIAQKFPGVRSRVAADRLLIMLSFEYVGELE